MTTASRQQTKTLVVTPIPCPGEDYDASHTTVASLASLRAMAESFDAIMDSIMDSTDERMERLEGISRRAERCRTLVEWMKKIGEYGGAVTVSAPSSYKQAIAGNKKKDVNGEEESEAVKEQTSDLYEALSSITSTTQTAIDQARIVSNAAVLNALRNDSMKDDGSARPSDLWLDRASGFDEHRACRNAERANSVPLLGRVYYRYRGDYYTMDDDEAAAAKNSANDGSVKNNAPKASRGDSKEQGPHIRRMENNDLQKMTFSGAASRQQAASGSTPYLCEVLHDAYGMGTVPPAGGEFYPEPTDVGELLVFNSSRKTYGGSMLSLGAGKMKKKAAANKKSKEEIDLIDLSDSHDNQEGINGTTENQNNRNGIDLLGGSAPSKGNTEEDDKILSSDFTHPRTKMLLQVPSYRPEAAPSSVGKLELPKDLDVANITDDEDDHAAHILDSSGESDKKKKELVNDGEFV